MPDKKPEPKRRQRTSAREKSLRQYTAYSPGLNQSRPYGAAENQETQPPKKSIAGLLSRLLLMFILLVLAAGIFIAVWDARNIAGASQKMFASGDIFSLVIGGSLKTDDNGRVNVLIAGYSADDPGHSGAKLTDSIMLLSMNPAVHTGYMLSIPRDMYVQIPGYGHSKINEAYPDGGMDLLVQTVQNMFDIDIGYYALVNYAAVRTVVDAVGGIDVNINSPEGKLYDPNKDWSTGGPLVDLSNGPHHLDGEQALDLTRARGDPSLYGIPIGFAQSDFQRTADQRMVFTAIKDKLNWKLILDPRKNGKILNAAAANIKTNVSVSQARPLFGLFNGIPTSKLQSLSLRDLDGHNYLASSHYEGDTLTPAAGLDDYSQINAALAEHNRQ
jgi:LCP family protein required for cell wall assembly